VQLTVIISGLLQVALAWQPPLFVAQGPPATQAGGVPEYPELHAQLLVPGPVVVQVALVTGPQPPFCVAHESTAVHVPPSPE